MDNKCHNRSQEMTRRVGYAYVPVQKLNKLYTPCKALAQGTIFPELDITLDEYQRGIYCGK